MYCVITVVIQYIISFFQYPSSCIRCMYARVVVANFSRLFDISLFAVTISLAVVCGQSVALSN